MSDLPRLPRGVHPIPHVSPDGTVYAIAVARDGQIVAHAAVSLSDDFFVANDRLWLALNRYERRFFADDLALFLTLHLTDRPLPIDGPTTTSPDKKGYDDGYSGLDRLNDDDDPWRS
jgi:hypothetical protein